MACELSPDPVALLETLLTEDTGADGTVFGGGSAVPGDFWSSFFELGSGATAALTPAALSNNKTQLDSVWPEELFTMSTADLNQYLRRARLSTKQEQHLKQARRRYKSRGYARKARAAAPASAAAADPTSPPASVSSLSTTTVSPSPASSSGAGADELRALQAELACLRNSVQEACRREQQLRDAAAQRGIAIPF